MPDAGVALGLRPCDQLHTMFVPCALDVAFCDGAGTILYIVTLAPWRVSRRIAGAKTAWEMRAGGLAQTVSVGDVLSLQTRSGER